MDSLSVDLLLLFSISSYLSIGLIHMLGEPHAYFVCCVVVVHSGLFFVCKFWHEVMPAIWHWSLGFDGFCEFRPGVQETDDNVIDIKDKEMAPPQAIV